jgi:hypothetical protein
MGSLDEALATRIFPSALLTTPSWWRIASGLIFLFSLETPTFLSTCHHARLDPRM